MFWTRTWWIRPCAATASGIVFVDSGMSALPDSAQETSLPDTEVVLPPAKPRMSTRNRLLFFATGWLIVLMPFLFWWNTWFGRQLSDKQLAEYLQDDKKPRHIQHALVQIGERVARNDPSVTHWYPDVVRLASYPIEEVRNTDAWVMGQDVSSKDAASAGFHADASENAGRFFGDGERQRGALAGPLRRCHRAAAYCRPAATRQSHRSPGRKDHRFQFAGNAHSSGRNHRETRVRGTNR